MKKADIKSLDALWATLVKETAKYQCEHCGRYDSRMEAAHIVGRRHRATRWGATIGDGYDFCGHCLCHTCHQQYDEHGPLEQDVIENTIGRERFEVIQALANHNVTKGQVFEFIEAELKKKGAAIIDDSPYASTL